MVYELVWVLTLTIDCVLFEVCVTKTELLEMNEGFGDLLEKMPDLLLGKDYLVGFFCTVEVP